MDEDFEFNSSMEEYNESWDAKLKIWKEQMVIEAIDDNYNAIFTHGISDQLHHDITQSELTDLNKTIIFMINHYEELEEYEKCAFLVKELKKITRLLNRIYST